MKGASRFHFSFFIFITCLSLFGGDAIKPRARAHLEPFRDHLHLHAAEAPLRAEGVAGRLEPDQIVAALVVHHPADGPGYVVRVDDSEATGLGSDISKAVLRL